MVSNGPLFIQPLFIDEFKESGDELVWKLSIVISFTAARDLPSQDELYPFKTIKLFKVLGKSLNLMLNSFSFQREVQIWIIVGVNTVE